MTQIKKCILILLKNCRQMWRDQDDSVWSIPQIHNRRRGQPLTGVWGKGVEFVCAVGEWWAFLLSLLRVCLWVYSFFLNSMEFCCEEHDLTFQGLSIEVRRNLEIRGIQMVRIVTFHSRQGLIVVRRKWSEEGLQHLIWQLLHISSCDCDKKYYGSPLERW